MVVSDYARILWAIAVWREARNQTLEVKLAVAHSINNRAEHPGWWGRDIVSVVLKPWQYSSFNPGDPNATKFPQENDTSWLASLDAVDKVIQGVPDPADGATHYYDKSLDNSPPAWAKAASTVSKGSIGDMRFFVAS